MLTGFIVKLIDLFERCFLTFSCFLLLVLFIYSSHSTSISTFNHLSSSNQFQFMSNNSYRNFLLRQYFIDLLNISDASLLRSMKQTNRIISNHRRKRKHVELDSSSSTPVFTLQSSNCLMIDNRVQTTFLWSQSIESLISIELIYHLDSTNIKPSILPLHLKFQHSQTFVELLTIDISLEFDFNREFYSVNILPYIIQINQSQLLIQSYLIDETCQTSHSYMIISSTTSFDFRQLQSNPLDSSTSVCKLKTIQIQFEDLGLAYLIIRPREYTFTYCEGTCILPQQSSSSSSMYALFQSLVNQQKPEIPQPRCAPRQFADDNFLVRQIDGTMEIYPIKDVIVKQCACL